MTVQNQSCSTYFAWGQGTQNSGAQGFRSILLILIIVFVIQLHRSLVGKLDGRPSRCVGKLIPQSNVRDAQVALRDEAGWLVTGLQSNAPEEMMSADRYAMCRTIYHIAIAMGAIFDMLVWVVWESVGLSRTKKNIDAKQLRRCRRISEVTVVAFA